MKRTISLVLLLLHVTFACTQDRKNDLAQTPPMGWNSWNLFQCDIQESLIRESADAMVQTGLKDAGFQYIIIDDCWQVTRDESGKLVADPDRFPGGMKALGEYIHGLGLKFGIYTCAGTSTCEGRPGSRGYEYQDMSQFADWGVDYVKVDWCNTSTQDPRASFSLIRDAIDKTARPMVLSICEWGFSKPWEWADGIGNMWRTTLDIADCWDCSTRTIYNGREIENHLGFTRILDLQEGLASYAGPGHWNDPDMLEVGNNNLTLEENRAHFSLWSILSAPLILGNDIRNISEEILAMLTNEEIIAVNQDPLGRQGVKIRDEGEKEVWSKQLGNGSRAILLFNRSESTDSILVRWNEIGYPSHLRATVRDLWQRKDLGEFSDSYGSAVPIHGVVAITVTPVVERNSQNK